jgi:hypothetical protein
MAHPNIDTVGQFQGLVWREGESGFCLRMSEDIGGLTLVGHWVHTESLTPVPETMSAAQAIKGNPKEMK